MRENPSLLPHHLQRLEDFEGQGHPLKRLENNWLMASNVMSWLSGKRKKSTEVETAQLWLCYRRSAMMAQQVYSYAAVVQAEPPEHFPWWHEAEEFVRPR